MSDARHGLAEYASRARAHAWVAVPSPHVGTTLLNPSQGGSGGNMHACGGMRARAPTSVVLSFGELPERVHAVVNGCSHVLIVVSRTVSEHARSDRRAARLLDPRVAESGVRPR